LKKTEEYLKRLKELRVQIEKKFNEKEARKGSLRSIQGKELLEKVGFLK